LCRGRGWVFCATSTSIEIPRDRENSKSGGFGGVGMRRARKVQTINRRTRCRVESLKENKGIEY